MWNKYESIIIFSDALDTERFTKQYLHTKELISEITKTKVTEDVVGKKRLAYEIKGHKEGWYIKYEFFATPDNVKEIERIYRITDDILKFITIHLDSSGIATVPESEQLHPEGSHSTPYTDDSTKKSPVDLFDLIFSGKPVPERTPASGKSEQSSAEETKPKEYVWTVLFKWTWEDGEGNVTVNVFNSHESAMKYWEHLVKDEQADYAERFSDRDSYEQSEKKEATRAEFNIWVVDSNERSQIILERKEVQ